MKSSSRCKEHLKLVAGGRRSPVLSARPRPECPTVGGREQDLETGEHSHEKVGEQRGGALCQLWWRNSLAQDTWLKPFCSFFLLCVSIAIQAIFLCVLDVVVLTAAVPSTFPPVNGS